MCYDGCGAETLQSSLVAETKGSRSTETSGLFCGKHARRNDLQCNESVAITSTWLRVFGQEPPSSAIRSFYADIFEITVPG